MRKGFKSLIIAFFVIFGFSAPSFAATEHYYAGGGGDDGLTTEIKWLTISDTSLMINDAYFPHGRTRDLFDEFGYVWVRIAGTWHQVDGGPGLPADENASTYEITITETISGVLVTAKLTISENNARWTITTDAPVDRILVSGNLGSDGGEVWYQPSSKVWWSNDFQEITSGPNIDPIIRFETTTGGTLRQEQSLTDGSSASNEFANTYALQESGRRSDQVAAISAGNTSEFQLSVCIFDYAISAFSTVTERNTYIDNLNDDNCGVPSSNIGFSWVGAQSISCPDANPWVEQELGFANKVTPLVMPSSNLVGRNISQSNLQNLFTDGVYFDAESKTVSTATEVLPIYGCNDKLLKAKIGKPIQFIVGGFTLQSEARGYIQGVSSNWYDLNGVTLHPDTAAFMHTVKFTKPGRYVVVITEQPDTSKGLIPTYGVRSVRFVINIK